MDTSAFKDESTPPEVLAELARDKNDQVRRSVARNESSSPELLSVLAPDNDPDVRLRAAHNSGTLLEDL